MDGEQIVGLVTHDMDKPAYIILNPQYTFLKAQMVDYTLENFSKDDNCQIFAHEDDYELVEVLKLAGFAQSEKSETCLFLDCSEKLEYNLDESFTITDFHESKDIDKFVAVIHKGFGNSGEPAKGLSINDFPEQPHQDPKLTVFIVAENGEYAAHCGVWHFPNTDFCYIEPVVTIPEYRGHGLGKAVVYEAVNRAIKIRAKKAIVISNQQFYYSIGFETYSICHLWEKEI